MADMTKCEWSDKHGCYIVCKKVLMSNLPGCSKFFWQEIYRAQVKTKKLKELVQN